MKLEPPALSESPGQFLHVGLEEEGVWVDAADDEVRDFGPHGLQLGVGAEIALVSAVQDIEWGDGRDFTAFIVEKAATKLLL